MLVDEFSSPARNAIRWNPRPMSVSATSRPPPWLSLVTELVPSPACAVPSSGTRLNSTIGMPTSAHCRASSGDSVVDAITMPST